MQSGAGVPAHQGTGARPTARYSTFQPRVLSIPLVPGSSAAYLRIVAQIAMSRDKVYLLISHIYEPPPEGAWVHYENGTLRDRSPDLYPAVRANGPGPLPLEVRIILWIPPQLFSCSIIPPAYRTNQLTTTTYIQFVLIRMTNFLNLSDTVHIKLDRKHL